jgi:hypothetical protein
MARLNRRSARFYFRRQLFAKRRHRARAKLILDQLASKG